MIQCNFRKFWKHAVAPSVLPLECQRKNARYIEVVHDARALIPGVEVREPSNMEFHDPVDDPVQIVKRDPFLGSKLFEFSANPIQSDRPCEM